MPVNCPMFCKLKIFNVRKIRYYCHISKVKRILLKSSINNILFVVVVVFINITLKFDETVAERSSSKNDLVPQHEIKETIRHHVGKRKHKKCYHMMYLDKLQSSLWFIWVTLFDFVVVVSFSMLKKNTTK